MFQMIKTYDIPVGPISPASIIPRHSMNGTPYVNRRSFQSYLPRSTFLPNFINTKALIAISEVSSIWAEANMKMTKP